MCYKYKGGAIIQLWFNLELSHSHYPDLINPRNVSKYTNWHWCIGERGWILITLYTKQTVTSLCMYVCLYDELNNLVEW